MAFIDETMAFDADAHEAPVIGIAANVGKHDSGVHQHKRAQLLFASRGSMMISLERLQCLLPPTKVAWIPAGVPHSVVMNAVVGYRSLYFDSGIAAQAGTSIRILAATPLFSALIERMAYWPWDKPSDEMTHTLALFFEELLMLPDQPLLLPQPTDRRLVGWLAQLKQSDNVPTLSELVPKVGASGKTLSRLFLKETGMSYQEWRQQWRLQKAIALLSTGVKVGDVAYRLSFASDSAFIAFFKQRVGCTPLQYINEDVRFC